ncbi:MAG: UDP-N-acetylglucosamine 2-epimerase (non-hydrolyzing), partial [Elusimicrobia bacterium]|nr:UDP-N-acetylglucosamine 2-epimerase (non-hydrolyzing) [Elusimicrobiota bacterium]
MRCSVMIVIGTRPDAIKMAPVCHAFKKNPFFKTSLLLTGQHRHMLDQALDVFSLKADYDLNIMEESQTLFHITRETLKKMEPLLATKRPDLVLVHGDTTTAAAATLACFYQHIPVGHVEAGLRSFDKNNPFPEELNRVLVDAVSSLHFAPTGQAYQNLINEHIPKKQIYITGNTVIDALAMIQRRNKPFSSAQLRSLEQRIQNNNKRLILVTAHRRENFGQPIQNICRALKKISTACDDLCIVYPVHPNPNITGPVHAILGTAQNIHCIKPVDYASMVR